MVKTGHEFELRCAERFNFIMQHGSALDQLMKKESITNIKYEDIIAHAVSLWLESF